VRAAKVKFDGGQVDQAIELLRTGAANYSCRTVFDALARLYEMKGVSDSVTLWKSRSSTIVNPCYSDIPFDTSKEPSPLPLLLSAMKKTESVLADTGFTCTFINVPDPEISAVIRYIDPKLYSLEAIILEKPAGMLISDLPADSSLHLVINGGYWEMDGSYRLSPSGLIISGGRNIAPLTTYGGSAVFYVRNRIPGLSWAKGFTITNDLTFALQCGPMLVEPDGRNGILTNDRVRLNRIAIGISGENVVIASVCGKKGKGLSLYDFAEFLRLPIDSGGTGCTVAMNLDGGGSVKAHTKNRNIPDIIGLWPVNNVIVVKNHSGK